MRLFHSIRWRLVASYVFLAVVMVGAIGVLVLQITREVIHNSTAQNLQDNARAFAQEARPLMEPVRNRGALGQLVETAAFLGDVRVRVRDAQGDLLVDSSRPSESGDAVFMLFPMFDEVFFEPYGVIIVQDPSGQGTVRVPSVFWDSVPAGASITVVRRHTGPWGSRFVFEPLPQGTRVPGVREVAREELEGELLWVTEPIGDPRNPLGFVELGGLPDTGEEALAVVGQALLVAGTGAVLLAILVGLWSSSRLTSPLRALQGTAQKMGAGDLSVRADVARKDEIGDLAAHFNQMAGALESSFQQLATERDSLRRFIADASHELRTPITALKNFVSLLQGPATGDAQVQAEFLDESQAQIERLEWITGNLLNLSRMDAGLVNFDLDEHDLREVVQRVPPTFAPQLEAKRLRLTLALPDSPVPLVCDPARLETALLNLLDNAIKYSREGEEITVGVEQSEGRTRLWVRDTGVGIDPDDLPHVFERFYRGRRHSDLPGSGLGLAIAKSLVEAQGGTVSVASTLDEGAVFEVVWGDDLDKPGRFPNHAG